MSSKKEPLISADSKENDDNGGRLITEKTFNKPSDIKILFVHGLECPPNGVKHQTMIKGGFEVYCPYIGAAMFDLRHKNSWIRKLCNQHLLPFLIVIAAIVTLAVLQPKYYIYILISIPVLYLLILIIFRKYWISFAISSSFNACVARTIANVKEIKPDLIVCASWGGAQTFYMLQNKIWNGPTIMLVPGWCPVQCVIHRKKYNNDNEDGTLYEDKEFMKKLLSIPDDENRTDKKWMIYQTDNDEWINYKDVEMIVEYNKDKFELVRTNDTDHGMSQFTESQLNDCIMKYMGCKSA